MFFDKKKQGGAAVGRVTPEGDTADDYDEVGPDELLQHLMQEFIDAVHGKDVAGAVDAFKALNACAEQDEAPPS